MRVGVSTTAIEPYICAGRLDGIGVYTTKLMQGLTDRQCDVEGLSFPPISQPRVSLQKGKGRVMPYSIAAAGALLTGGYCKAAMEVDVFHVTDYRVLPMKCPVVATLYDAIPLMHPEFANARLRWLKNAMQKGVAQFADRIIAISQYSVAELVEYFDIPEERISVIHCGVDASWFKPLPDTLMSAVMEKYGLHQGYFLSVGTLQPRKNIGRVLDAYLKLPAAIRRLRKLVVVGKVGWGCDELVGRLLALASGGEVIWLNQVREEADLRALYQAAGVFVFPSLYEGFGLPVLESFAAGTPVICSNTTSLPEVSQGVAVELDPLSVDDIASAMEWLADDDSECEERIALGRVRAEAMNWNHMVDETLSLYRSLL